MWNRIRLYVETKRTKKDVAKLEREKLLLTDEEDIENLKILIELRKALWSKDFYTYTGRDSP